MLESIISNTPLSYFFSGLWRDEAFSFLLAHRDMLSIIRITAQDFNPPFYYLLLHLWMKLFGSSEGLIRSFSFSVFILNIYIVYLFLVNVLKVNKKNIITYLVFFALNPLLLYYAFEARMYSLFALFATASFYYFYNGHKKAFIVTSVLGMYTHYYFIFVLFSQFIWLLYDKRFLPLGKRMKPFFIIGIFFLPWFAYVARHISANTGDFWLEKARVYDIASSLGVLYTGYEHHFFDFFDRSIIFLSCGLLLFIIYCIKTIKKDSVHQLLLLWSFFGFFLILALSFLKPLFIPRYVIFATVGFMLLLFYYLEKLPKWISLITIVSLFVITIYFWYYQLAFRTKGTERRVLQEIAQLAGRNDLLYVSDAGDYLTAAYYFDEKRVFIYGRSYSDTPHYIGRVIINPDRFVNELPQYPQKAFVMTGNETYEIQSAY